MAPIYLKGHRYGAFVFYQPFARLVGDLGLGYDPKLLVVLSVSPI